MNGTAALTVGGEFDGIGLLALGLHLAGLRHAWLCEVDPWRRERLEQRFPGVPIFDDVRAVGAATARPVDVIAGGFPCKGVSSAGGGAGFGHPETVLWREMLRTVRELRPRYVLVENVANLLRLRPPGGQPGDLFREVLGGLSALGFDVVWDCLPAAAVGAPHRRDRVFAVASHPDRIGWDEGRPALRGRQPEAERRGEAAPDPDGPGQLRDGGQRREQGGRPHAGGEREVATDSARKSDGAQRRGPLGDAAGDGPQVVNRPGGLGQAFADAESERRTSGEPATIGDGFLADARAARGVGVEWGDFGPAIRRWESAAGPAPEPLVRRVDDGSTRRVERSRLSALGDGVCVQIGQIAGAYILDLERERVAA